MNIALIIPCYNCEKQIKRIISGLSNIDLQKINSLCFIDNKSSDSTINSIHDSVKESRNMLPDNIYIIEHLENYNLGGSFKTAYKFSIENNFSHIVWLHGDDQSSVEDIHLLLSELKDDVDVVFGTRFSSSSKRFNYSNLRTLGNYFFNLLFSLLLLKKITDIGSGLNLFKVDSLKTAKIELWPNHMAYDLNFLFHFKDRHKVRWAPITWKVSDEKSNITLFGIGRTLITMFCSYIINKNKIIISDTNKQNRQIRLTKC
jgi:glycosyltransferase involved in cell wall biosynthesis